MSYEGDEALYDTQSDGCSHKPKWRCLKPKCTWDEMGSMEGRCRPIKCSERKYSCRLDNSCEVVRDSNNNKKCVDKSKPTYGGGYTLTKEKMKTPLGDRNVYIGPRGGKYVKIRGALVNIKKVATSSKK